VDKAVAWVLLGLILLAAAAVIAFFGAHTIIFIARCAKKLTRRS